MGSKKAKKSRPADMCGWTGHIQGNGALRVCEPLCGECAVQRSILSPGGYQGERISVPRMRAEMGSPWSVALLRHAEPPREGRREEGSCVFHSRKGGVAVDGAVALDAQPAETVGKAEVLLQPGRGEGGQALPGDAVA